MFYHSATNINKIRSEAVIAKRHNGIHTHVSLCICIQRFVQVFQHF